MPNYTVESPTGKRITFEWTGPGEPTDADFDEVFAEAGGGVAPAISSLDTMTSPHGGPTVADESLAPDTTAPSDVSSGVNPLWGLANPAFPAFPEVGRGNVKGLGQGAFNLYKLGASAFGPPPTMPEALQTDDAGMLERLGAFGGRIAPGLLVPGSGWASAIGGGALSGAMESGTPEGAAIGAATGGAFKGGNAALGAMGRLAEGLPAPMQKAVSRIPGALVGAAAGRMMGEDWKSAAIGALLGGTGRGGRVARALGFGVRKENPLAAMKAAAAEAKALQAAAIAEEKALLAARAGAETTAEGLGQGSFRADPFDEVEGVLAQRFPPPPTRPDALSSGTSTAVPTPRSNLGRTLKKTGSERTFRETSTNPTASAEIGEESLEKAAAKNKPYDDEGGSSSGGRSSSPFPPPPTTEAVTAARKAATTPQERGAMLRDLAGKGKTKAERGAALSDHTNPPLDADVAAEARAILDEAGGSLEKALQITLDLTKEGHSIRDVNLMMRALREVGRRGK